MKKLIALSLIFVCFLSGCQSNSKETSQSTSSSKEESSQSEATQYDKSAELAKVKADLDTLDVFILMESHVPTFEGDYVSGYAYEGQDLPPTTTALMIKFAYEGDSHLTDINIFQGEKELTAVKNKSYNMEGGFFAIFFIGTEAEGKELEVEIANEDVGYSRRIPLMQRAELPITKSGPVEVGDFVESGGRPYYISSFRKNDGIGSEYDGNTNNTNYYMVWNVYLIPCDGIFTRSLKKEDFSTDNDKVQIYVNVQSQLDMLGSYDMERFSEIVSLKADLFSENDSIDADTVIDTLTDTLENTTLNLGTTTIK